MRAVLVTHTHWDREWYRTFQDFRSRLVDAVDRVLDLCGADPGFHFLLDGQSIVLEDYVAIRPGRRAELEARIRAGRIAIGPWYVQPDSLLPSGEAHVRNLLLGRSVGEDFGPVSRVGYTPDSFGHPAQFPLLFAGFGIDCFLYWRGNGSEVDDLRAEYWWEAQDGTRILAAHLRCGYFNAQTGQGTDLDVAAQRIGAVARQLAAATDSDHILLLNGIDHALPDPRTGQLAQALAKETGFEVERGLLEDFVAPLTAAGEEVARPSFRGELVGGRMAPLLPGVWSARTWIKLMNRHCESLLEGWAEPWSALAARLGMPDESPSLRAAWRELLPNQAHDSICGCSRDRVHEQMRPRFESVEELARLTTERSLERLAGLGVERRTPWSAAFDLAVFNPSPHPRSDVVRYAIDPHPYQVPGSSHDPRDWIHPIVLQEMVGARFYADGEPIRLLESEAEGRVALIPDRPAWDLELPVRDVPAFGWKRVRVTCLAPGEEGGEPAADALDDGREIEAGSVGVRVAGDGSLDVSFGDRHFPGLCALEDHGDRGDTYDHDILEPRAGEVELSECRVTRLRHPSGIQRLRVERVLSLPAGLAGDRDSRAPERVQLPVTVEVRVAPTAERVDLWVAVDNRAEDHRLRLLFPLPAPVADFEAASTFGVVGRTPGARPDAGWINPAMPTFPQQGFVHAGGLSVVAPGLHEAEVNGDGVIAITLLRAVGHLSRHDLRSRRGPAGPGTATPAAQCPGRLTAALSLFSGLDPGAARDAELGLRAVACGDDAVLDAGRPLLTLGPEPLLLSALKPAEDGRGLIARVLNPGASPVSGELTLGFPFAAAEAVRLDEEADPAGGGCVRDGDTLRLELPAHGLRSVRIL